MQVLVSIYNSNAKFGSISEAILTEKKIARNFTRTESGAQQVLRFPEGLLVYYCSHCRKTTFHSPKIILKIFFVALICFHLSDVHGLMSATAQMWRPLVWPDFIQGSNSDDQTWRLVPLSTGSSISQAQDPRLLRLRLSFPLARIFVDHSHFINMNHPNDILLALQ